MCDPKRLTNDHREYSRIVEGAGAILFELRRDGWMVAIHNDYMQGDKFMTFWLFTKDNRAAKGEGENDYEALRRARLDTL